MRHHAIHLTEGFSLLEVLIALAIITIVLLGIVTLQINSLREVYLVYEKSVALAQVEDLIERLRANAAPAARNQELANWNQQLPFFLPQGVGDYQCSSSSHLCTVNISWQQHGAQSFSVSSLL